MKNSWQTWVWRVTLVSLFVLALSVSLFWANGFRYDFISNQLRRTGIIDISYSDVQARGYLDGKELDEKLPFVINNVLPGKYLLAVGREGYWDYNQEVHVEADLISRVNSVFLYPLDILANSKKILEFGKNEPGAIVLNGGYVWRQDGDALFFARLKTILTQNDFRQVAGISGNLKTISVYGKEAFLENDQGGRYVLDLLEAELKPFKIPDNYIFTPEKWLYFEGKVLAAFDRNFNKVIWVKQPLVDQTIRAFKYFYLGDREFLAMDFSPGEKSGGLYELKSEQLIPLDEGIIDGVSLTDDGDLLYVKNDREIWSYRAADSRSVFLKRFQDKVQLISTAPRIYNSQNLIVFKLKDRYLLADRSFGNVREMFPGNNVGQMFLSVPKNVYFIQTITETQQEVSAVLRYLDLEN